MGFWRTYRKVLDVRVSISIQRSLETLMTKVIKVVLFNLNSKRIIEESNRKNNEWESLLNEKRNELK